jgi:preprotein translocase subunit SecD
MDKAGHVLTEIIIGVIGLAIVAVVVSQSAQTSGVISSFGTALSGVIKAAVAPVSGGSTV